MRIGFSPRLLRYVLLPLALVSGTGVPLDPAQAQPVRVDQPDMAVDKTMLEGRLRELEMAEPPRRPREAP